MRRRQALGLLGAAAAAGVEAAPSARDRFAGVYKLVSYQRKAPNGDVTGPYGPNPVGRITYDKAGRMSALLMRPGRKPPKDPGAVTLEEYREVHRGFVAYMGTFDVDETSRTVVHHVEAALHPAWVGTDLKRHYEFSGNRLTLSIPGPTTTTLVWEREKD
jgi:hypothetical protein